MGEFREIRSGVYFLCKNQEVVYIGQSCDVETRIDQHVDTKDFDSVLAISVPGALLDEVEHYWIERIKPYLNAEYRPKAELKKRITNACVIQPEQELKRPSEWGDAEDVERIFGLKRGTLYKLADADCIASKWLKKGIRERRGRLFSFQSIREFLEANVISS